MKDKDHDNKVQRVAAWIIDHLEDDLSLKRLAQVASCSPFHLHRLFQAKMGLSLGEYIRMQRLEYSLPDLLKGRDVLEVALDSGYATHAAFSKAFKKEMKMTPSEFREQYQHQKERMMSLFKNKPAEHLGFQSMPETPILFVRQTGNYFESAPRAWRLLEEALAPHGLSLAGVSCWGMSHDNPHAEAVRMDQLRFDACMRKDSVPEAVAASLALQEGLLPEGLHACFRYQGPWMTLGDPFHYIYGHWLYEADQHFRNAPPMVHYQDMGQQLPDEQRITQIWVPVLPPEERMQKSE